MKDILQKQFQVRTHRPLSNHSYPTNPLPIPIQTKAQYKLFQPRHSHAQRVARDLPSWISRGHRRQRGPEPVLEHGLHIWLSQLRQRQRVLIVGGSSSLMPSQCLGRLETLFLWRPSPEHHPKHLRNFDLSEGQFSAIRASHPQVSLRSLALDS